MGIRGKKGEKSNPTGAKDGGDRKKAENKE